MLAHFEQGSLLRGDHTTQHTDYELTHVPAQEEEYLPWTSSVPTLASLPTIYVRKCPAWDLRSPTGYVPLAHLSCKIKYVLMYH